MEIRLSGLSLVNAYNDKVESEPQLPYVEDGVEDASKDMHLSYAMSNEEVCFMFDWTYDDSNRVVSNGTQEERSNMEGFEGSMFSHGSLRKEEGLKGNSDEEEVDNFYGSAFSFHDASTVKGRN